jgi:hypothetical protein
MIVLHEAKWPADHGVLEIGGPVHRGDLAGEGVPDAKVLRAPGYALPEIDESAADALRRHCGCSAMNVSGEVHFDASCEVETAFDGSVDGRVFTKGDHDFEHVQL